MKSKEFIFCAIDFSDLDESKIFISKIIDHIGGVKIGLEFFLKNGYQLSSYHQRDLDLPFIGTLNDVKEYSIKELIQLLEKNLLPNFFNLVLKPSN